MAFRELVRTGALLALLVVVCADAAGTRQLRAAQTAPTGAQSAKIAAQAPGSAAPAPPSDILFTVSAPIAVLTAGSLSLAAVSPVVQSFTHMSQTAVFTTADFANSSAGARFVSAGGHWLGQPVAVLKATAGNQSVSALLALSAPHCDATAHTLVFQAKVLPATPATRLPASGGAAERLISDSANGLASGILTSAPASDTLTNVGLFIDQNSQGLGAPGVAEGGGAFRSFSYGP